MDFYEEYNRISSAVEAGELRPDELSDEGYLVYKLGAGSVKYDDLNEDAVGFLNKEFEGGPSFTGGVVNEATQGFKTMQRGIRQNPIYDFALGLGQYDYRNRPTDAVVGAVKSAYNIPMGLMQIQGAPATSATDVLMRNTRIPDNTLTRVPLAIAAGTVQDAGTMLPLRGLGRAMGLLKKTNPNAIRMVEETLAAPASGIEPIPAQGARQIDPLAPAAQGVHVPTLYERALKLLHGNREKTPYLDAVGDLVEEAVKKDKKVLPLSKMADETVVYAQSGEFRAWAGQITTALEKEGYSPEAITAFLRSRAKFMVNPGSTPNAEEYARAQVVKDITKLAESNPELAEKLGIVYKPKEPLGPSPQAEIFGREETATPAYIERTGRTTGTTWEQTVPALGQLEGRGVQLDLNLPPAVLEAQRDTARLNTITDIMTGKKVDQITRMKDPAFGLKLNNLLRKSISGLVTGPGTAFRNLTNQTIRKGLEIPISVYEEILTGGSVDDALKNIAAQLGTVVDYRGAGNAMELLTDAQKQRLAYKGMYGEVPSNLPSFEFPGGPTTIKDALLYPGRVAGAVANKGSEKLFNLANLGNKHIEEYAWLSAFKGELDSWAAKTGIKGIKIEQAPEAVLTKAFDRAMELTYSRDLPAGFKEGWEKAMNMHFGPIPVGVFVQEAAPFARFSWGNAFMDILDMSPAGLYRAAIMRGDAHEAGRIMGKAAVGNRMLQVALRDKEVPQGEWYEMDMPGMGKVDVRRWHPLDAYAMAAELIHRPLGSSNARVTKADLAQLLAGGNRLDDTVVGTFIGMYMGESTQSIDRSLGQIAGSYLSRWTTPFKWAQLGQQIGSLATTGSLGESGVQRDLNTNAFGLGGALDRPAANIPWVAEKLPARIDPTSPNTPGIQSATELTLKLFGLDPIQTNRVKEELKRLKFTGPKGKDFGSHLADQLDVEGERFKSGELDVPKAADYLLKLYARTGDPTTNRSLNERMSKVGSVLLDKILDLPGYEGLSDAKRRVVMDEVISGMRAAFRRAEKAGVAPYQAVDNWLRTQSPAIRGLLDELAKEQKSRYIKPSAPGGARMKPIGS